MRNLLVSLFILVLLSGTQSCTGGKTETKNVKAVAQELLDTPFHFLLSMPDYEPDRLVHDADLFSNWGDLTLAYKGAVQPARAAVRERLLRSAREAGWEVVKDLPDVESPQDLRHYGITQAKEDLDISKKLGRNQSTHYSCRIWISENGNWILVAYRIDGN